MDLHQLGPGLLAQLGIQVGKGLIQQEVGCLFHNGPGQGYPLFLSPGEFLGVALGQSIQLENLHCLVGPLGDFLGVQFLDLQAEGDVVPYSHVGIERIALEHHSDVPFAGSQVVDPGTAHVQVTAGDGFQSGNHPQGGGLAAAGRSQEDQPFSGLDGKIQVPDHLIGAVDFGNMMESETGRRSIFLHGIVLSALHA